MTAEHTFAHMRSEYFAGNRVTDRSNRDTWIKAGEKDAWARANDLVRAKLEAAKAGTIPEDLDKALQERFDLKTL